MKTGEKHSHLQAEEMGLRRNQSCCPGHDASCLAVHTGPTVQEPRVGKVQAKRLEEDAKSCRSCRHAYPLLAGTAAVAADTLFSLLSWLTQQTQP